MTTTPKPTTDNPHTRLVDELKLKRPECVSALRVLVNRKIAERKLGRAA